MPFVLYSGEPGILATGGRLVGEGYSATGSESVACGGGIGRDSFGSVGFGGEGSSLVEERMLAKDMGLLVRSVFCDD